ADTLFIADSNRVGAFPSNHRVLVYKGASSMFPPPSAELTYDRKCPVCLGKASVVLGQPDFTTTTLNIAANRSALRLATAVTSDGVRPSVTDPGNNRVLVWNTIPTANGAPADVAIGQPDLISSRANNAATADATTGKQTPVLCTTSNGTDVNNNPTYPSRC